MNYLANRQLDKKKNFGRIFSLVTNCIALSSRSDPPAYVLRLTNMNSNYSNCDGMILSRSTAHICFLTGKEPLWTAGVLEDCQYSVVRVTGRRLLMAATNTFSECNVYLMRASLHNILMYSVFSQHGSRQSFHGVLFLFTLITVFFLIMQKTGMNSSTLW